MRTLVLVDNNKDDLLFIKEALASIDPEVQCLSFIYSEEAMNALMNNILDGPAAVFMNLNMPRRNGIQCLMELRSNPEFDTLPIFLYAPKVTIEVVEALKASGVTTAFEKPDTMLGWKKIMRDMLTSMNSPTVNFRALFKNSGLYIEFQSDE
jgi:response regulator RpfG family c-di-GMP phosphodiesterase